MSEANKPAFPVAENHIVACDLDWTGGVSKREYYAAKALNGMLAHSTRYKPRIGAPENWHEAISEEAFEIADAMIAETERHNDMLALVETLADQNEHSMHSSIQAWAVKEARRILGRSE